MKFGIGQSAPRKEDARLITGNGRFLGDSFPHGTLHAAIVRAPVAHAAIIAIGTDAAVRAPGVRAVLTGADYSSDGIGGVSCHTLIPGMHGGNLINPDCPALATERLLYVGMAVAIVIADTRQHARDAVELVELELEEKPPLVTVEQAMEQGAEPLWDGAHDNIAFSVNLGNADQTRAALERAAKTLTLALTNNRISANSMEMRGALATYEEYDQRLTLETSTQAPHSVRSAVAHAIKLPDNSVRVVAKDVGGGFGMKGGVYPEDILIAWAAMRVGKPVLWRADRSESLQTDYHGRDQKVTAQIGFDADLKVTALKVDCLYNTGAFLSPGAGVSPMFAAALATGVYDIPVAHVSAHAVFTNTSPTQPYRGAGRPEAAYLIERLMDLAARELGVDRVDLRRRNLVRADQMPYQTALVYKFDCGDFEKVMDEALALADWAGFDQRRQAAKQRGVLRGIGLAVHMENAGLGNDQATIRFDPSGGVTILAGTFNHGQGHETVYAQMVSDWLGVPFDTIRLTQGDTAAVDFGRGTIASRSMVVGGGALRVAADRVIERGKALSAHFMEASPNDIEFADGAFVVTGTDKKMPLTQVAKMSFAPILPPHLGLGLTGVGEFLLQGYTFPNGCQVVEVEIDPQTGATELVRLSSADDVGRAINPVLLEGQLVGGIVQGLGQAVMEDVAYEEDTGQLLTGSFMDYAMPRADDIPPMEIALNNIPTATNPLGVKGAGEAGTVGATPAIISAILDALAPSGIKAIELPATPARIWQALNRS